MAKDIWSVCDFVKKYKSTNYNGVDWTDPKNNTWSNFPWSDFSRTEKSYIKTLWNFWNNKKDAGKFIFFDIVNLAPTNGENYGYQSKKIPDNKKTFFKHLPIPKNNNTPQYKYVSTDSFKRLQSQEKNKDGKKTEKEIQNIILSNIEIDEDDIKHPAESEFKLTWMREMVERGIDGVIGPFIATLDSKTGKPKKTQDGRVIYKIDQNSLDRFINNRDDYKKAIWEDWLQSQLDFATKDPSGYKKSPFAKVSKEDLDILKKGGTLPGVEEEFILTEAIHGKLSEQSNSDQVFRRLYDKTKTPKFNKGVMANVNKDYTISGWIRIPEIYGNLQLPWPFVWRFIGREGIMQRTVWESSGRPEFINPELSVVKIVDKLAIQQNKSNVPNHVPFYNQFGGPTFEYLAFDVRSRYWHHRYSTKEIPDRELMFLMRYKYGAAGSVEDRFISDDNITDMSSNTSDEWDAIKQCGGVPVEGVTIIRRRLLDSGNEIRITYLPYKNDGSLYRLRSKYICQIHDTVGWNRFGGGDTGHVLPSTTGVDFGTPLKGEPFEIVDYDKEEGYYSFTGGTSDRQPIQEGILADDYKLYEYKRDFKLDVRKNHISLWRLINEKEPSKEGVPSDSNDRFVTPDSKITGEEIINGKKRTCKTVYHNHANNYLFNFKDAFYPGLYSDKELQFLYELVSYVYYGKINQESVAVASPIRTGVRTQLVFRSIFDRRYLDLESNKHRWREIGSTVSSDSLSFLMDYISWAAPTNEQYRKVKFSIADFDNFVKRYKEKLSTSDINWINEVTYPVHSFAKKIIESESSKIPTVPAWVHYKYISRTLNSGENGIDRELTDDDVYRVFGGKKDDIDTGKLIALPSFVLMGRVDLGEDKSSWPGGKWGECPFSKDSNGQLVVGNLDAVLDAWAQQELHNGKYVSSMEILFWLRYKRGLASAPSQRTVRYPINIEGVEKVNYKWTTENKNYWPKESFIYVKSDSDRVSFASYNSRELQDGDILPTETLHNIPILTSYYHPIYSDGSADEGVLFKNADPLIDIENEPRIEGKEETAYTGWNSKYVAQWNGARPIPSNSLTLTPFTPFEFDKYPDTLSKLNQSHTKPFKKVNDFYISIQNGKKYDGKKGLEFGFSFDKVINTSDVQCWFRARRIIQIHDEYALYIENGISKPEGEKDSVIPVKAYEFNTDTNTPILENGKPKEYVLFISGEPIGNRYTGMESFKKENLIIRPWTHNFKDQPELDALLDDYSLGTKQCIPQYRYMRHIIQPIDFMYFFPKGSLSEKVGAYSQEQSYNTLKWMTRMTMTDSITCFGGRLDQLGKVSLRALILRTCVSNDLSKKLSELTETADDAYGVISDAISSKLFKTLSLTSKFGKNLGTYAKYSWRLYNLKSKVKTIGQAYYAETESDLIKRSEAIQKVLKKYVEMPLFYTKLAARVFEDIEKGNFGGTTLFYLGKELGFKLIVDAKLKKLSEEVFKEEIKKRAAMDLTRAAQNLSRLSSWASFGITMAVELIVWQIDLILQDIEEEDKIENMWKLLNQASKGDPKLAPYGWVEGPFMETKGVMRIPKGPDGTIEGNYDPTELQNQGIKNIPSQPQSGDGFWDRNVPDATDKTVLKDFIDRHNEKFYKPNGLAKTIGKNLKEGSCECQFLTSLFAETPTFKNDSNYRVQEKGTPYNRKNWQKGPFIRQWKNRELIIDDAPTYSDIPITFAKSERPRYDTENLMDLMDRPSNQISGLQVPAAWLGKVNVQGRSTNIRLNGQGGTKAVSMADCPRFWWPNILHVSTSDDLCQYMGIDGKYPSKMPEIYSMCDGISGAYSLQDKIGIERNKKDKYFISADIFGSPLRKYARSAFIPKSGINYQSVTSGILHTENGSNVENNVQFGNTVISLQGVDGIAPPHEREIVRLFRMKYRIDIVNPNNNCCSIGEILEENTTSESQSANNLENRQNDATKCEYIIKLNDERFHKIVKESCIKNKTQDNSQENVNRELANNTTNNIRKPDIRVIDSAVISGSIQLSMNSSLIGGGWSDNRRKKKSRRKNPCVPGCVDCCDEDRPIPPGVEVSERQIAITNVDTTFANSPSANLNRYQAINNTMGILENIGNSFSSIIGGIRGYFTEEVKEPRSTPLGPADSEKSKKYRDSLKKKRSETQPQQSNETLTQPNTNTTNTV